MPVIRLRAFSGLRPMRAADLLALGEAQTAVNAKLSGGDLEPFKGLQSVATLASVGTVKSIYRYGLTLESDTQHWFETTVDADFVRGPVLNDTEERTYFTSVGNPPRKTKSDIATTSAPYPTTSYKMGVPVPATAPSAAVSGSPSDPNSSAETVTYVVTYVTTWGEEGPPSLASNVVTWRAGQTINLTNIPTAPGGNYTIQDKRLYRAATGTNGTQFQYVTTLALATTSYNDTATTSSLGEVLVTDGWDEPPDTMVGLTAMANGVLAGFDGNTLCLSEPFHPYAWPTRYRQSVDAPIVGLAAFDQSLFIGTKTGIYIATGADPGTMTLEKLAVEQSCVSKRSIVEMLGGVVFASPDGLFLFDRSGLRNLTDGLMTRTEWQAYKPSSIDAFEADNRYLAFYNTGSTTGGLIFTFGAESSLVTTDLHASAGYRDSAKDALFLVTGSTQLQKWDAGANLSYTWTSGVFRLPKECSMAAARVEAAAYPVTLELYADGALKHTQVVNNRFAFRLPGDYRATRFHVKLTGSNTVRSVEVATSMAELALDG